MIEGFVVQPYPLWAVLVLPGQWVPITSRVVGWMQQEDALPGRLTPVLAFGVRTLVVRESHHVDFFDTEDAADRRGPAFAEAARLDTDAERRPEDA